LQGVGASEELAQGIVRAIYDIYVPNVATKSDLADLRAEIVETREALRSEMAQIRVEMSQLTTKNDMAETRETLRKEMMVIQNRLIFWVLGTGLGAVALVMCPERDFV